MKYLLSIVLLFASLVAVGQTYSKDLEKAAKKGDVAAQRDLGICYLTGIKVDNKKAFEWLCQAATSQDAQAQYYLGVMFEDGKADLTKDKKGYYANLLRTLDSRERQTAQTTPALLWYLKAASGNNDQAMLKLAYLSRDQKDEGSAMRYFKMAADLGNSEAQSEYQAFVGKLAASGITITDNDLIIMSDIEKSDYKHGKYERMIILNSVSHIGYGAFRSIEVKEIIFQEGDNLLTIDTYGLACGKGIKELVFNRPVHIKTAGLRNCCPDLLVFNKDVEYIGEDAFGDDKGVKKVVFKKVPKKIECRWHHNFIEGDKDGYLNCDEIEIPTETEAAFVSLGFDKKKLYEQGGTPLTLDIKLEKPNTILSVLPANKLSSVDSLTITGFMYETDLKILESCKNMRYLDLSKTYITYSPEKMKADRAEKEYMAALFSFMGEAADAKYNDFEMSTLDHAYVKGFAKLMEQSYQVTEADEGCIIPSYAMSNMMKLETLILPVRASKIGGQSFKNCKNLKNIKLPPFLKTIGSGTFYGCISLENIDFPASLTSIGRAHTNGVLEGEGSFIKTGLKKFDLSKCNFAVNNSIYGRSWDYRFEQMDNLREIRLPNGVSKIELRTMPRENITIYVPETVQVMTLGVTKNITLHFASSTPPEFKDFGNVYIENCTIYIPKGSTTAYYAKYGSSNKYIEE